MSFHPVENFFATTALLHSLFSTFLKQIIWVSVPPSVVQETLLGKLIYRKEGCCKW